jgi:hypothetical protein
MGFQRVNEMNALPFDRSAVVYNCLKALPETIQRDVCNGCLPFWKWDCLTIEVWQVAQNAANDEETYQTVYSAMKQYYSK